MRVAIVGLGYVGLPLALEVARKFQGAVGFDINRKRVQELRDHIDITSEVGPDALRDTFLDITADPEALRGTDFFIVAVPTPVDGWNRPDLGPVIRASETIGRVLGKGAIVVYESTVYPGGHGGDLRPDTGADVRPRVRDRLQARLFAGAHQPGRQGPHRGPDHQDRLRAGRGEPPDHRRVLRRHHPGGDPPGLLHQGGGSRQGDREHPAGHQHRPDERAGHHLRPDGHPHLRGAGRGQDQVELPAASPRAWSGATASASTRTTSPPRPRSWATTRR